MTNTDERLKKDFGSNRQSRAMEDRAVTESRVLSDDQRLDMFRQQLFNASLPNLPDIPGYRTIWLTTTNQNDPIHRRLMLGYELIKASDIPGWDHASVKSGEWEGCVGVNEMIAAKIREDLWLKYMSFNHHEAPLSEDEKLTAAADTLREQAKRIGAELLESAGQRELREKRISPVFN